MQRILLVVAILYLVWRVLNAYGRRLAGRSRGAEDFSQFSARRRDREGAAQQQPVSGGDLVACTNCATCVPRERVLWGGSELPYCCSECRDLAAGEPSDRARHE